MNPRGSVAGAHINRLQGTRDSRDGLHRSANAQLLPIRHATFDTACTVGQPPHTIFGALDFVVCLRSTATRLFETVADFDAFHRLDTHQRACQLRIQASFARNVGAKADRQPIHNDLNDPAERVARFLRSLNARDHVRLGVLVKRTNRGSINCLNIGEAWRFSCVRHRLPNRHHMGKHLNPENLTQVATGNRTGCYAGSSLSCRGTLKHRTCRTETVFDHAGEIGVPRTRTGQRRTATSAQLFCHLRVRGINRLSRHDRGPLRPLGVANLDSHRATDG